MNAQTEMTEAQRQLDNKLLRLIQQHFPSIPLHGEEADKNWNRWLNFARDCAHLTKPDAGGGEAVCMPQPVRCGYVVKVKDSTLSGSPYIFTIGYDVVTLEQCKAYADARVSEATRELVDGLQQAKNALDILWLSHHANRTDAAIEKCNELIAKYTQTQKE